jgi:uncharacterized MAPEG superfamily protein
MMTNTGCALIGLAVWAIVLTFVLLGVRVNAIKNGSPPNGFDPTGKDMAGFGYRVTRAHLNMLENLAIPASLMLYAIAAGQTAITEGLACWVLYARIGQSITHFIGTSVALVSVRGTFFGVQLAICLIWAWKFWNAA